MVLLYVQAVAEWLGSQLQMWPVLVLFSWQDASEVAGIASGQPGGWTYYIYPYKPLIYISNLQCFTYVIYLGDYKLERWPALTQAEPRGQLIVHWGSKSLCPQ